MTRFNSVFVGLCALFFSTVTLGDNHHASQFINTDVFELEVAADPQISPDGSQVVYVRNSNDIMTDRARANLWIINTDGSEHRPLLSGTDTYSSPRWSPDGTRLAYISSAEGRGPELFVRWMDSGQTALLSNLEHPPSGIAWSNDGEQIAFSMLVESEPVTLTTSPDKPEGAEWAPGVTVIDELTYRADGRGYLERGYSHVFVIPTEGGTPRQITSGEFNHGGRLSWSPDNEVIVLSANRNADWRYRNRNSDLWSVNVSSSEMTQLTSRNGPDYAPAFSPDGSRIAFLGYEDEYLGYQNVEASMLEIDSGSISLLTETLDRSVISLDWAGSSSSLLISYDDFGERNLASLDMEGNSQSMLSDMGGVGISRPYTSGSYSVANDGSYAYTASSTLQPADVAVGRRGEGISKLTALNEDLLGHKQLGSVEKISWRSSVGDYDVYGWMVMPPDFDPARKYPLLLEIHGGPFTAYGPYFSTEVQLYAAAGYIVLYTNPRGSTSYGSQFSNEIHHNYPGQDYDDLMSGVDSVIDRGFIDEDQLFVTGGSGGGVLSAWIVGNTDRFAAAAVAKPVINWISHALYSDIPEGVTRYWFEKMPWEDPDEYWRRSPLSLVGDVSTPTLLLTGEADHRTPIAESEQFYQALKLREIDTMLVRVPEASHGIAERPSQQIAKVDNILGWFERYRNQDE
ncbi:MAG: S9 family peptidase [Gammaproteobacteria bacterium]|nr:S9 family peptidase [Gammaproteobacteria bacterium]